MDLSLLSGSASDNNTQRTGARFTVRSANSPSYSFTRRSGFRRRETAQTRAGPNGANNVGDTRVKDQSEENEGSGHQLPTMLDQNGTADKSTAENDTDRGVKSVFESQRTEGRGSYLPSRSQSFGWKSGAKSPVRSPRTDQSVPSTEGEANFRKRLDERRTGRNHFLLEDKSPVNPNNLTSDQLSRGNSLPFRLKYESGPGSKPTETLSPKGGQSIQKLIQKLYESAGEKTEGGTFPRRFSSGDNSSPVQNRVMSIWNQKDTDTFRFESPVSPHATKPKASSPANWQRPVSMHSEEVHNWEKEMVEMGTKSLDRARSRNTKAAQIRSSRTDGQISGLLDTLCRRGERTANPNLEDRTGSLKTQEKDKGTNEGNKLTKLKGVTAHDDVFDTDTQKITLKTAEKKQLPEHLSVPSSDSVRSKISQFEALTQKATIQIPMPRRTFSVPARIHKGDDGVKKSRSVREMSKQRDDWETLRDGEVKDTGRGKPFGSERSLSVDEVGLRLGKAETDEKDFSDDSDKYSKLKKTMHIPVNDETQRHRRIFYFDETDFSRSSNSEDSAEKDTPTSIQPSLLSSCAQPQPEVSSPLSEDDKTPTNVPDNWPFNPPAPPSENTPSIANKSPPAAAQENKTKEADTIIPDVFTRQKDKLNKTDCPPSLPATSSESNTSDVFYPDVTTAYPKGKKQLLDLSAWVASLNPEFKSWSDYMDNFEDDDQSTQKDDDSNYDSDSGDSSVTVTSVMSQSDHRSFSLSLSDLCTFSGVECEPDDMDEWDQRGRRSASLSSDASAFSCVSLLPSEELDKLVEDVRSLGDEALQDYDDVQVVVLHKEAGVGLGLSLAGGVDQNKPITVHKVFPSGVAAQEGSINEGDRVLSINGTALSGNTHTEALRVLKRAKTRGMAVVVLRKGDVSDALKKVVQKDNEQTAQTQQETGQRLCVRLLKNSRDLGFSLQGGVGSSEGNRPLTVQKIFQGGPVDLVFPGDEVLEIQGISVLGMRRLEAWTFIRSLPSGPVEVVLCRFLKRHQM